MKSVDLMYRLEGDPDEKCWHPLSVLWPVFPNRYFLMARWILEGLIVHESGGQDGFSVIQVFPAKRFHLHLD